MALDNIITLENAVIAVDDHIVLYRGESFGGEG